MAKVAGERMTADERAGKRTWWCQWDGNELAERQSGDPTGRVKDPACGRSWWAATPPSKEDVAERAEAMRAEKEQRAEAFKAAGVKDPDAK